MPEDPDSIFFHHGQVNYILFYVQVAIGCTDQILKMCFIIHGNTACKLVITTHNLLSI